MDSSNMIADLLMKEDCGGLYVGEYMPKTKRDNAIAHFPIPLDLNVIALIDCTVMGSCKNGLAITDAGLIWKNSWTTPSPKSNLTWSEFFEVRNDLQVDGYDIVFGHYGRLSLAGSSMSSVDAFKVFTNLSNFIVDVLADNEDEDIIDEDENQCEEIEQIPLVQNNVSDSSLYAEIIPELISICMTADGEIEEGEVELATAFIESDELISDKARALDSLSNNMENMLVDREKSKAIFKMKISPIVAKVSKITDQLQKDKINIILEGMLEAATEDDSTDTIDVINNIRSKV